MTGSTPKADLGQESLDALVAAALAGFADATTTAELKQARLAHSGDRSPLALANRAIGTLPGTERKDAGQRIGTARAQVAAALAEREAAVGAAELAARLASERIDVTLPVELVPEGAPHPITSLIELMSDVFTSMGWEIAEGPEAEGEWLNFDALNIGPDHPARGTTDTLFVEPLENHIVLRTHTSPVQARSMLTRDLPIYIVCPGKVYRADEFDATHVPVFHQIEGLCIDKGISLANLKGTLDHLAKAMFGQEIETRMRPHYFPFTEPSAEVDLKCFVCHGASVGNPEAPCRTCKSQGWIEWGGCGVVNPRVLIACGIDPEVYSGFAFGMGIERTLMFRNNAADMRDMVEGDVRFSRSLKGLAR
ncbi:phenylalanine--tRNA ligase subunit alpha [Propionicimonas sp.]|uniref:phenylalanine--tRNA ligase subunit alpha n=1 Tax=Propionicimonas sp. TaxID=1955623 RepID=UPI0017F743A2|nr:phenylalanine--tRNA ligase subunit alpha [Propionicimonas sp.]MBU3976250.1 phenylalanine--tRNA ligase subunit alpha [Actinomycetota bacterium]MBA3021062.1 phenylalanine--tRNA ligase subunit alpha [Propionicimonas sp.]MBU3985645.1 phenylalanine--tRNA ligase subunit alpha [Actinomycetota bacterium]MBU4008430.1 phenylalanine--tRNA ligase subunit alpha [Actinomycetota bacterium]MBU4066420.1 phenylalanine--tRNA ligase subunit alpha [Actinomycetota bacterium]